VFKFTFVPLHFNMNRSSTFFFFSSACAPFLTALRNRSSFVVPRSLFLAACALLFAACQQHRLPLRDRLAEKSEPYDLFAFQRSYPDSVFDWQGWRLALQQVREAETAVAERAGGCGGNPTRWTLQGPSNVAGRVNALAVKPDDQNTVLAGFAGGGIFKSTDGAVTWKPVFDDNLELSISDITFDPKNPNIVYAGTGDANMPSQVYNGYGIFKSTDAGETWHYLGLGEQGIISHIVIDPTNSQILYAAVNGNPFVRNDQRGVFKSTNGGQTWQRIHFVSTQAGASDLVIHPTNPQILYASYWDRIRSNTESTVYGPNAKVFKTIDGGATWTQLGGGLPTGKMGRTGLAISQQNPEKLYVVYVDTLSQPGALYQTVNGGQTWTALNIGGVSSTYAGFGWYFGKIDLNPTNDEEVFFHGILLWRRSANGVGWSVASGGHADSHDLVWTPSGRRYWANDGGVYRNEPGTPTTWPKSKNLPTTQFYHTDFNPHTPNTYWCGAQDNGIQKGSGADINNWVAVFSADGFHSAFHPTDPQIFWVEIQNGAIHRTTDGGVNWQFGTTCLGTGDRCNWDTPFFISKHTPSLLYAATYRVYASSDGTGWGVASGDLTDGLVFEPRFHNISCLAESPVQAQKLIAGTSDGNVWWRSPAGAWTNVTAGLPDRYVTSVHGSPTSTVRMFVTHSGIKFGEDIPHVHRSDNNGQTWVNISGDLPKIPVNDFFVLPNHADSVLFAATDAGTYFTLNGGQRWSRLGGNLPYVAVFDLEHNPVRRELLAATFGRSLWTFPLDSIFVKANIAVTTTVSGNVKTETNEGIDAVRVRQTPPVFSTATGQYSLPGVPGCQPYEVEPYHNDAPLNGVSTYDLVLISKHILGLEPLGSPYKLIAADANRSGTVTTFDIVTLRRLILGIDTVFLNNTSWRFVPKEYIFPDPLNPFKTAFPEKAALSLQTSPAVDVNFVGIKIGDLNASASPHFGGPAEDRTEGEWPVFVEEEKFAAGERVDIQFSASLAEVAGAQFSLQFDRTQLELEKIEPLLAGLSLENFNLQKSGEGWLSLSFEHREAFKKQTGTPAQVAAQPMFRLIFRARTSGHTAGLFRLNPTPTRPAAFRADGAMLQPVLRGLPVRTTHVIVQPNPFGAAGIWLMLPDAVDAEAVLQIFDLQGKSIFEKQIASPDHDLPIHLPAGIFPNAGAYFYQVMMGGRTWRGKIVKGE